MFETLKHVELLCFELSCFKLLQKLYLRSRSFLEQQLSDIIYGHNYIDLNVLRIQLATGLFLFNKSCSWNVFEKCGQTPEQH